MVFPVSGVQVPLVIPPLIAFLIALFTTPAGVSGAFLLLPYQVSLLHFTSPAVTPTNLVYNLVAIPGGLIRYIRERRMVWPITWIITAGTLPGVFIGVWVRLTFLPDPRSFKCFIGMVLLYLAIRLLLEVIKREIHHCQPEWRAKEMNTCNRLFRIKNDPNGESYSFNPMVLGGVSLIVGVIGGVYGIGGGAIMAPFCTIILKLPFAIIAGPALAGTLITSAAGIGYYYILWACHPRGQSLMVVPDWQLGILFGVGGLMGSYFGACLQKYFPERLVKAILGSSVSFIAITYIFEVLFW